MTSELMEGKVSCYIDIIILNISLLSAKCHKVIYFPFACKRVIDFWGTVYN